MRIHGYSYSFHLKFKGRPRQCVLDRRGGILKTKILLAILIQDTLSRQYEGHNTPLGFYTVYSVMASGCIVA